MLEKLRAGEYADADAMKPDFQLIVKNCRVYNDDRAKISGVCQTAMAMCFSAVRAAFVGKVPTSYTREVTVGAGTSKQKRKKVEFSGGDGGDGEKREVTAGAGASKQKRKKA